MTGTSKSTQGLSAVGLTIRNHTSRWLTRAQRRIRDPRAAFERVVRRIVRAHLPATRREILGPVPDAPLPTPGQAPPPRGPRGGGGNPISAGAEPPSGPRELSPEFDPN